MDLPQIMTFYPTIEEFKDFSGFIHKMEKMGAHKAGLAKVIPPKGWVARKSGYKNIGSTIIPCPITQEIQGRGGVYEVYNMEPRNMKSGGMTVLEFQKKAASKEYATPLHSDADDLERRYWTNIAYNPPLYGADVSGSLYDKDQDAWNIGHLQTILDSVFSTLGDEGGLKIEGVNTAYLYFGMWKSTFAWHTEDMDLYSINYLHFGAPKFWYAVPPKYGRRLERVAQMFFKNKADQCPGFLRHKCYLLSPTILKKFNVPFHKMMQEEGQFMITFPYAYHAGFNHGYNCAESTNFATERWIEYGKRCRRCYCIREMVQIDMDCFVKKYQPGKYKAWINDEDVAPHPEDDEKRKVSRSQSLAGCSRKAGDGEPSKRHPLSINFGSTPGKESTSTKKELPKRRLEVADEGVRKRLKKLPGKTLKTSLRSKLKKRSILVSCRKSVDTRPQKLKPASNSVKIGEKKAAKAPIGRSRRFINLRSSNEKQGIESTDKTGTRSLSSGDEAKDLSTFSARNFVLSIPDISNEADWSNFAPPPSMTAATSQPIRGRRNFLRRQCKNDFYTPLAERVKLRRASDVEKNCRSDNEAPQLERVETIHPSIEREEDGNFLKSKDVEPSTPDLPLISESAQDLSAKASPSLGHAMASAVSMRRRPMRRRTSKPKKSSEQDGDGSSQPRITMPSDPEEPQMPQLVPVSSGGDPRILRSHYREDFGGSGKDAPVLDCFR